MKKYLILLSFLPIIFLAGCDGAFEVRGYVFESNFNGSEAISDSLFNSLKLSNGIQGVFIQIDPAVEDSIINRENFEHFAFKTFTDSIGYFRFNSSFAPGKYIAGIVASKDGYVNDTLFFSWSGAGTPVNVIVNLKQK
jgi:hypothetical protein